MSTRSKWQGFLDALEAVLLHGADISVLSAQMAKPWQDLMATLKDIAAAAPTPDEAFLNEDPNRRADQMSVDQWCEAAAAAYVNQATNNLRADHLAMAALPTAAEIAAALKAALHGIEHLIPVETLLRYGYQVRQHLDANTMAERLAEDWKRATASAASVDALQWNPDVPLDDATKEQNEVTDQPHVIPPAWLTSISDTLANVPGMSSSNMQLGNRLQRQIMISYRGGAGLPDQSHAKHLVVIDGSCWLKENFRISAALDDPGDLTPDQVALLARYKQVMISPETGRRIRPDIADLFPAASLVSDDWGWFEIKPFKSLATGLDELWLYYMLIWNEGLTTTDPRRAHAGSWFPPLVYAETDCVCVCVNVYGCIGYLVIKSEAAKPVVVLVLMALFNHFGDQILKDAEKLAKDVAIGEVEGAIVLALIALLVAVVVLIVLAIAGEIVIAAAALGELAVALGAIAAALGPRLSQLVPAMAH